MMSKEKIISAFLNLVKKNPYSKITISQIMSTANMTRTYFYQFFDNKQSLTRETLFSVLKDFFDYLDITFDKDKQVNYQNVLKGVDFLFKHKKTIQLLIDVQDSNFNLQTEFQYEIKALIKQQIVRSNKRTTYEEDYFAEIFSVSALTTISWFLTNNKITSQEVTELIIKCVSTGLLSILEPIK